jgi:UDP-N-acetylglucosamine acyltransferase
MGGCADIATAGGAGNAGAGFVDPRAAIDPGARLGPGCSVGPFAVIGPEVALGAGNVVHAHAVVLGPTAMGDGNEVHPFAVLGGAPQDLRHKGEPTRLEIGHRNVFREHVTVSRGTAHGGGVTVVGDDNLLMIGCHVAHDCRFGNRIVMANHATLAGHAIVGDHAVFGGLVGVGPFVRVGESAMLAAGAMIDRDVAPFCIAAGDRARLVGVNRVGLRRRGFSVAARAQIKRILRLLKVAGTPVAEIAAALAAEAELTAEARRMLDFLLGATRGFLR